MRCLKCASMDIDFQESTGQSICVNCGTVLEESTIVSSIEFQESGDRSHVIGQYVAANCSKPYTSGSRMLNRHIESRDTALINARRLMSQLASSLKLQPIYVDRAYRLFQLSLQKNLALGRRQTQIVAVCLYIICRQEKSPYLLIDFADILQLNVFILGRAFLLFAGVLNISLPVIDPSLYIHRYASLFDFKDIQASVVTCSLRIVTRLKKDWIVTGRRPDGVCAAALYISARAHGFYLHHQDVAQLFRIATETLKKRLLEFQQTPSAQLNIVEFSKNDNMTEFDPPAFIRNVLQDRKNVSDITITVEGDEVFCEENFDVQSLVQDEVYQRADEGENVVLIHTRQISFDLLDYDKQVSFSIADIEGKRNLTSQKHQERLALYDSIYSEVANEVTNLDTKLGHSASQAVGWGSQKQHNKTSNKKQVLVVSLGNQGKKSKQDGVVNVMKGKEEVGAEPDDIAPLSDSEALNYLHNEKEQRKRALIWNQTFGSFMEERARKKRERERGTSESTGERYTETGKLRKKYVKRVKGNAEGASGAVLEASSSIRGISKKINYEALKGMFDEEGAFAVPVPPTSSHEVIPPGPRSSATATTITNKSEDVRAVSKGSLSGPQASKSHEDNGERKAVEVYEGENEDGFVYEEEDILDQDYDYDEDYD